MVVLTTQSDDIFHEAEELLRLFLGMTAVRAQEQEGGSVDYRITIDTHYEQARRIARRPAAKRFVSVFGRFAAFAAPRPKPRGEIRAVFADEKAFARKLHALGRADGHSTDETFI